MDTPYYNNVQYAELSDFFMFGSGALVIVPGFSASINNKADEAVANPARDGPTGRNELIRYDAGILRMLPCSKPTV